MSTSTFPREVCVTLMLPPPWPPDPTGCEAVVLELPVPHALSVSRVPAATATRLGIFMVPPDCLQQEVRGTGGDTFDVAPVKTLRNLGLDVSRRASPAPR